MLIQELQRVTIHVGGWGSSTRKRLRSRKETGMLEKEHEAHARVRWDMVKESSRDWKAFSLASLDKQLLFLSSGHVKAFPAWSRRWDIHFEVTL